MILNSAKGFEKDILELDNGSGGKKSENFPEKLGNP